jgi:Flp pilus assembly protein TadB
VVVCCGTTALVAAVIGGVALAAVGQFTAVTTVGLGIVVLIAWRLDRHRHGRTAQVADPLAHVVEETTP